MKYNFAGYNILGSVIYFQNLKYFCSIFPCILWLLMKILIFLLLGADGFLVMPLGLFLYFVFLTSWLWCVMESFFSGHVCLEFHIPLVIESHLHSLSLRSFLLKFCYIFCLLHLILSLMFLLQYESSGLTLRRFRLLEHSMHAPQLHSLYMPQLLSYLCLQTRNLFFCILLSLNGDVCDCFFFI